MKMLFDSTQRVGTGPVSDKVALRNIARTSNLRNRDIRPNIVVFQDGRFMVKNENTALVVYQQDLCKCGNMLVVTDYGRVCRQCVLETRMD